VVTGAMKEYVADVKRGTFPADEHCYHLVEGEEAGFRELTKRYAR
jgi:3-methyl-2-oxobutanoate hydroxymethyltransferase